MEEKNVYHPTLTVRTLFNLSVIAAFLLVGFSVFYYFVIFLPGRERVNDDQKEKCLRRVEENYRTNWDKNCKSINLEPGCNLHSNLAETVNNNRWQLMDACLKRYPQ